MKFYTLFRVFQNIYVNTGAWSSIAHVCYLVSASNAATDAARVMPKLALFSVCHCWRAVVGWLVGRCETWSMILIHLEAWESGSVHAKPCQCHLNSFVFEIALCPCACNHGITVINVIGQWGSICSLFRRLRGCLLPLCFECCWVAVLPRLVLVGVRVPRAGSGGCWPAVSSYVVVVCDRPADCLQRFLALFISSTASGWACGVSSKKSYVSSL